MGQEKGFMKITDYYYLLILLLTQEIPSSKSNQGDVITQGRLARRCDRKPFLSWEIITEIFMND